MVEGVVKRATEIAKEERKMRYGVFLQRMVGRAKEKMLYQETQREPWRGGAQNFDTPEDVAKT